MNKIIVSIIFVVILVVGINKIADVIFYVDKPEKSAYQVANIADATNTTTSETISGNTESGNIMALFASASSAEGAKFLKNVQHATVLTKEVVTRLVQLCGGFLEDKRVLFLIINIQKLWQHMVKFGHLKKWMVF